MTNKWNRLLSALLFSGSLVTMAAEETPIKVVPAATPISALGKPDLAVVKYAKFNSSIMENAVLGSLTQGWLMQEQVLRWNKVVRESWNRAFEKLGYPTPKRADALFKEIGHEETALQLGLLIRSVKEKLHKTGTHEYSGTIYLDTTWVLFSPRTMKALLEVPVEGTYQTATGEDYVELMEEAASVLVRNLLAKPEYLAALAVPKEKVETPGQASFSFPAVPAPKGDLASNSSELSAAVVTLNTDSGSGSGFYIAKSGYLLTNSHVVGDSTFVKVVTATGRELPGEVVKVSTRRDVALVKTCEVPYKPLSVNPRDPKVGGDVYVIGSPLGGKFSGTMTRGILSGFRMINNMQFLQSDVSVTHGNSGGPLLDSSGAVLGLVVMGLKVEGGNMNFFIPIAEALSELSIELKP